MAAAVVTTSKIEAAATSVTASITAPAVGSVLVVFIISSDSASAAHTCKDAYGNVYTKDANIDNSTAGGISVWHTVVQANAPTFNLTIGSTAASGIVGLVTELSGMDLVNLTDGAGGTAAPANGTALSTPVKVNLYPDDILMAGMGNNGGTPAVVAPDRGWTRAGTEPNGSFMISESAYIQVKSPGSQQTTWTWTGSLLSYGVVMAYRAAPDPAPLPAPREANPRRAATRTAMVL